MHRVVGETIGPPALIEYAVLPVGVDIMRPSAWTMVTNLPSMCSSKAERPASVPRSTAIEDEECERAEWVGQRSKVCAYHLIQCEESSLHFRVPCTVESTLDTHAWRHDQWCPCAIRACASESSQTQFNLERGMLYSDFNGVSVMPMMALNTCSLSSHMTGVRKPKEPSARQIAGGTLPEPSKRVA